MGLAVALWPAALAPNARLQLIALATPGESRVRAARMIREAIRETLARQALPARLADEPGEAPRLILPDGGRIGLSISHSEGLSIAAIALDRAVGVDLVRIKDQSDALVVARDYLGPAAATRIAAIPRPERASAFALAWSAQEAKLKCLGLPLTEWSEALETRLSRCAVQPLALPEAWAGSVATLERASGYDRICRNIAV